MFPSVVMAAFRLGTVNPQERHTSDTQPSSKAAVVSGVESKVSADGPLFVTGLDGIQVHGPSPGTLPSRSFVYESTGKRNYNKGQPPTADRFAHASSSLRQVFFRADDIDGSGVE